MADSESCPATVNAHTAKAITNSRGYQRPARLRGSGTASSHSRRQWRERPPPAAEQPPYLTQPTPLQCIGDTQQVVSSIEFHPLGSDAATRDFPDLADLGKGKEERGATTVATSAWLLNSYDALRE